MQSRRPFAAVLWALSAMALTGVLYVGVRVFTDFTLFSIQRIDIRGNVLTSGETLTRTLGLTLGASLFDAKINELTERAASLPWVKSTKVYRRIPDTIVVEIEEWEPAFLVRLGGLYYMTAEGHVVEAPLARGLDFPVVTGLTWERLNKHGLDRERLLATLALVAEGHFGDRVEEIHYDPTLGITIYAGEEKPYGVYLGFGDLEEKFSRLGRMRSSLKKKGLYASSADVSYEDRIVARLTPLPAPDQQGVGR